MLNVILYTRKDCHLCDEVKAELLSLQAEQPHQLVEVDVDEDPALRDKYGEFVPVVQVGPYVRRAPISRQDLLVSLAAARDRESQLTSLEDPNFLRRKERSSQVTRGDRLSLWIADHYLLMANLLVLIYLGLPFLAPVMMKQGWTAPAGVIYKAYSYVCHNLGYRSWYLFGEQAAYPRAAAGVAGLETFEEVTGIGASNTLLDLNAARTFVGNEQLGYKVAFCERDVAMYFGILLFGLAYAVTRRKIPPLHWVLWILIGLGPIGLDGFSQLLSQIPNSWIPYRESTPLLRTLTGFIFGWMTAWYGIPIVEETMRDTKRALLVKFRRLGETVK